MPIELHVSADVAQIIDEIFPLYLNVYERFEVTFRKADEGLFSQARTNDAGPSTLLRLALQRQGGCVW